jgi:hypothetical protein
MAKKARKVQPTLQPDALKKATFEVRFKGPGISPAKVSLRAVSDALSAVQDLASGRDPYETAQVPASKLIGLVGVRSGSAVYACVARSPIEARANLSLVGDILSGDDDAPLDERAVAAFRPIESLSDIAKSIGCRLEVSLVGPQRRQRLFSVGQGDYERLAARLFIEGETSVVGTVERVGGATATKCLLRVPGRRKLLYCSVRDKDVARRLGQHLYEEISAYGTAVWISRAWRIHEFTVHDFRQPRMTDVNKALDDLRKSGMDAWDSIRDPQAYASRM